MPSTHRRTDNPQPGDPFYVPASVSAEFREQLALKKLARAFIELGRLQVQYQKVVDALTQQEHVTASTFHDCECLDYKTQPFVAFERGQLVCKLPKSAVLLAYPDARLTPWKPNRADPVEGWIMISLDRAWVECAQLALQLIQQPPTHLQDQEAA